MTDEYGLHHVATGPDPQLERWLQEFPSTWTKTGTGTSFSSLMYLEVKTVTDSVNIFQYPMPLEAEKDSTPHIRRLLDLVSSGLCSQPGTHFCCLSRSFTPMITDWSRICGRSTRGWLTHTPQCLMHITYSARCPQTGSGTLLSLFQSVSSPQGSTVLRLERQSRDQQQ